MLVIEEMLDRSRADASDCRPTSCASATSIARASTTHYGQAVKDAERIARIWEQLKQSSEFAARRARSIAVQCRASAHASAASRSRRSKFGISFTATFFNQAGALVLIYRDGSVQVNHGGTEMGQGLHTKIRQIAADASACRSSGPPDADAHRQGAEHVRHRRVGRHRPERRRRARRVPPIRATLGRWRPRCWTATRRRALQTAACMRRRSSVHLRSPKSCEAAYRQRVPLFAQGYYRTPEIHYDPKTGSGRPFYYFAYGAAVSEVEVDGFTGQYRLLRADILEDVGDSVSPLVDRGQIEGGFIQGVGWLTLEELLWDAEGRLATDGASTYKLPSWSEVPDEFHVDFLTRAAEPGVVFGSKAVGEPPLMLAISVREAIRDAVAAFAGPARRRTCRRSTVRRPPNGSSLPSRRGRSPRRRVPPGAAHSSTVARTVSLQELRRDRTATLRGCRRAGSSRTRRGWPSACGPAGRSQSVDALHAAMAAAIVARASRRSSWR